MYDVKLWVALDENDEDVLIEDAIIGKKYRCPECGQFVFPKAKKSNKVTEHYCHEKSTECDGGGESALHRYWKNRLFKIGDKCDLPGVGSFVVENRWEERPTPDGTYKPDLILKTNLQDHKFIIIEIFASNKKDIPKYKDTWDKYKYPVYEIDVNGLAKEDHVSPDNIKILYLNHLDEFIENNVKTIDTCYGFMEEYYPMQFCKSKTWNHFYNWKIETVYEDLKELRYAIKDNLKNFDSIDFDLIIKDTKSCYWPKPLYKNVIKNIDMVALNMKIFRESFYKS